MGARVGRAEWSSLDVGVDDSSAGEVTLYVCRHTRSDGASSTGNTRRAGIGISGEGRVEPVHVDVVVVPQRHDEDHALCESIAHALNATLSSEVVGVAEDGLLVLAEVIVDCVAANTCDVALGLIEDLATLDVLAADLNKVAVSGVVGGNELSDDCERLGGVDGLAWAVERSVAHSERVEIAPVLITEALISVAIATSTICVVCAGWRFC